MSTTVAPFDELWDSLAAIGRPRPAGGYQRLPWTEPELACRTWFRHQAAARDLRFEVDRNANLWAWWGDPGAPEVVVSGSHLDSVPDGGAFDGALGVVSAFAAIDRLREDVERTRRPIAVVAFTEEEGARFGRACLGSQLMTGAIAPEAARALRDADGVTLEACLRNAGFDPASLGPDPDRLQPIRAYLEVHIEQGAVLVGADAPIGVATEIWPHGRFRFELRGEANHAGTTPLELRRDPMLAFARAVLAAREAAASRGGLATFGRLLVEPNSTNSIAALVTAWLDARAPSPEAVEQIVADVAAAAASEPVRESWTPSVRFDESLRDRLIAALGAPPVPTGAGHDAAILAAAGVPAAMLFVRNRSGVSHAPNELADRADCLIAVDALANALAELACS